MDRRRRMHSHVHPITWNPICPADLFWISPSWRLRESFFYSLYELWRDEQPSEMNAADRNRLVTLRSWCGQHRGSTAVQWTACQRCQRWQWGPNQTRVCACWEMWGGGYLMRQRGEVVQSPHLGIFSSRWLGVEWSDQQWVITCVLKQFLYFMFK